MKILAVHNRYRIRAGEDNVFDQETKLLEQNGHIIKRWTVDNQEINDSNIFSKIGLAINTIWSISSYKKMSFILQEFQPDIVHIHNILPLLSPSIFYACKKHEIPVVQTIHNYRLGCPAATFFRDGQICEQCLEKNLWQAVKYRCYRQSFLQTLIVAAMLQIHRWLDTWNRVVDGYIALTPFMKDKLIEIGIKPEKIHIKPNFIDDKNLRPKNQEITFGKYYLFVGRLSPEKGIQFLLDAFPKTQSQYPLVIIGSGELEYLVQEAASKQPSIQYLGQQSQGKVREYMREAIALCFPSIWNEPFGLTILEAHISDTPVIVSNINSITKLIIDGVDIICKSWRPDELKKKLTYIEHDPQRWGIQKRTTLKKTDYIFFSKYNIQVLLEIYEKQKTNF